MRTLLPALVAWLCTSSCALWYPPHGPKTLKPESPAPSAERIAELMEIAGPVVSPERAFDLQVNPPIVFAGNATWVTCFVPRSWPRGRIVISVPGLWTADVALDRVENRYLVQHVPCGTWPVSCAVYVGNSETRRLERQIESRGECNSGGQ